MRRCDLNKVIAGSITGRGEVMVAIAGLAEEVAHLALHVKRIVAISDAAEAEWAEAVIRVAAARATETVEQAEFKATSAATACDAHAIDMEEAANFPLSPQQDSWTRNARISDKDAVDELNAGSSRLAKVEAARAEPKDSSRRAENAIAARICELHDRLGGFIKPQLSQPDQNT
jgi:hypothetical protein